MDRLISNQDLAAYLAVSVETVRWLRKQHRGPRAIKVGRSVRYRESDVQLWLAERTEVAS